jgi:hypothetical protein
MMTAENLIFITRFLDGSRHRNLPFCGEGDAQSGPRSGDAATALLQREDCNMEDYKNSMDPPSVIVASAANHCLFILVGIRRNNEYFLVESKGPLYTDLEYPVASLEGPTIRFLEVLG